MIEVILAVVAILASIYAIYTDMKFRYIDNWLTWGLVVVGIAGNGLISILTKSFTPVLYSIGSAAVFFGIANILFYTGTFGGGDVKLLMGFAAMLPLYSTNAMWPFPITMLINCLLIGSVYSTIYLIIKAIQNKKDFKKYFKVNFTKHKVLFYVLLPATLLPLLSFIFDVLLGFMMSLLVVLLWLSLLLFIFTKSVSETMVYFGELDKLEIGDHPVTNVRFKGRLIYKQRITGLNEKEIELIKKLKIKKIKLKDGVPFAPALSAGLIVSVFVGDLITIILTAML